MSSNAKKRKILMSSILLVGTAVIACLAMDSVMAGTIGDVAASATESIAGLARFITAMAYVAGMGFAVGAVLKFKAHKDNPTQIPVGTPIALIFIAAALIFLPSIFEIAGESLFGTGAKTGGVKGLEEF